MQKQIGQLSFADDLVNGATNFLSEVDQVLDFGLLEQELSGIYSSGTGRPSYPLLMLFKTLLLQQWYNLSDPGMEEALCDRISFRRFESRGFVVKRGTMLETPRLFKARRSRSVACLQG